MGHWAYLVACRALDDVQRCALLVEDCEDLEGRAELEPQLGAKYRIPLYWLAAFDETCVRTVRRDFEVEEGEEPCFDDFLVFWSPTTAALERLRRRRDGVLALVEPRDAPLYDDWIEFVGRNYPQSILVQPEDLIAMAPETVSEQLVAALKALSALDVGQPLEDTAPLKHVGALDLRSQGGVNTVEDYAIERRAGLVGWGPEIETWPGPPTAEEIAAAEAAFQPPPRAEQIRPANATRAQAAKPWWKFWARVQASRAT